MNPVIPALSVRNLSVAFNGELVLEDVTFALQRGVLAALVGPNGAGKTTLLRSILGLVVPLRGEIDIFGEPLRRLNCIRHRVGYVSQAPKLDRGFPLSAFDVVVMGRLSLSHLCRRLSSDDRHAATRALALVGLEARARVPMGDLSGGQQQRVLLARALVREPELLLLDEPGTGLDADSKATLYEILASLRRERQVTTVIVAHDFRRILAHADEVICVNRTLHIHEKPRGIVRDPMALRLLGCDFEVLTTLAERRSDQ